VLAGAIGMGRSPGEAKGVSSNPPPPVRAKASTVRAHSAQPERSFRPDLSRRSGARERDRSEATRGLVSGRLGLGFQGFLLSDRRATELEHVGIVD
jgi:hypothetical protein